MFFNIQKTQVFPGVGEKQGGTNTQHSGHKVNISQTALMVDIYCIIIISCRKNEVRIS